MMQAMKQAISESRRLWRSSDDHRKLCFSLSFSSRSAPSISGSASRLSSVRLQQISLFVCIVILTLLFAKLTEYILDQEYIERDRSGPLSDRRPLRDHLDLHSPLSADRAFCRDISFDHPLGEPRRRPQPIFRLEPRHLDRRDHQHPGLAQEKRGIFRLRQIVA